MTEHIRNVHTKINLVISQDREGERQGVDWKKWPYFILTLYIYWTLKYALAGTVITEWDAGKELCAEFLNSEAESRAFADQLVAIAAHCGFDGWLLNIENSLQVVFDPN